MIAETRYEAWYNTPQEAMSGLSPADFDRLFEQVKDE